MKYNSDKANFYNKRLENLEFISVGSPEKEVDVAQSVNKLGAKYGGMINHRNDIVPLIFGDHHLEFPSFSKHLFDNYILESEELKRKVNTVSEGNINDK